MRLVAASDGVERCPGCGLVLAEDARCPWSVRGRGRDSGTVYDYSGRRPRACALAPDPSTDPFPEGF